MVWKEKYKVGVDLIDRQHEQLFSRVSDFLFHLRSREDWTEKVTKVNETLAFMKDYVIVHFRDEEAYQKSIGYPELKKHQEFHRQMVQDVQNFAVQYENGGYQEQLVQQFAGKLLAWLIHHVAAEDQKIAEYDKRSKGDLS